MRARARTGDQAQVAVVGAGWVGRGLLRQLQASPALRPAVVVNRTPDNAVTAYRAIGHPDADIVVSDEPDRLAAAVAARRPAVTDSLAAAAAVPDVDVVVEATGAIDFGATVILGLLEAGKHVVSINAEVEAAVGYLLHDVARTRGVVYTMADGDQPGVLLRQLDFVEGMGFEPIAAVNCKRHLDVHQTPDSGRAYAARDGTSPAITTAAGDGTKMHIENAVVANTRGLPPDRRGMHGVRSTLATALADVLGAISRPGVVEYTLGGDFGAGVFVIGRAPDPEAVRQAMRFVKMGEGAEYLFFRPYHLVHLEVPLTVAEVVLDRQPIATPSTPPVAEVIAVAKRDLRPGERLDGLGGHTSYGVIDTVAGADGLLPVALTEAARLRRPVRRDEPIPLDAVELDETAAIVGLRRRQDALIRGRR